MTGKDTIGWGVQTPLKQEHFTHFFHQFATICGKILQKRHPWADHRLFVFDITAGCGVHPVTEERGSPLIIIETLQELGMDFRAYFIEQQPDSFAELTHRLAFAVEQSDASSITGVCGDHVEELPRVLSTLRNLDKAFFGLLYYDFIKQDSNRSLAFLSDLYGGERFRKQLNLTDCLMYLSATDIKRVRGAFLQRPSLLSYMRNIRKKHWLIRDKAGANQYTFLLGTNWVDMPACKKIGLYSIREGQGRDTFWELNYTKEEYRLVEQNKILFHNGQKPYRNYTEYLHHPEFLAVRAEAFARARGICEWCARERATDAHHLIYPPWGTLDTVDNLYAVCRPCHCLLEGKKT